MSAEVAETRNPESHQRWGCRSWGSLILIRARAAEALRVALEEHRVVAARRLAHEGLGGGEELEEALHQPGAEAGAWLLESSERQTLPVTSEAAKPALSEAPGGQIGASRCARASAVTEVCGMSCAACGVWRAAWRMVSGVFCDV